MCDGEVRFGSGWFLVRCPEASQAFKQCACVQNYPSIGFDVGAGTDSTSTALVARDLDEQKRSRCPVQDPGKPQALPGYVRDLLISASNH